MEMWYIIIIGIVEVDFFTHFLPIWIVSVKYIVSRDGSLQQMQLRRFTGYINTCSYKEHNLEIRICSYIAYSWWYRRYITGKYSVGQFLKMGFESSIMWQLTNLRCWSCTRPPLEIVAISFIRIAIHEMWCLSNKVAFDESIIFCCRSLFYIYLSSS